MTGVNLKQAEADALFALEKRRSDDTEWDYPGLGGAITILLVSTDGREPFLLDLQRGRINLAKGTYSESRTSGRGSRAVRFRRRTASQP